MKLFSSNKPHISIDFASSEIKIVEGLVTKAGVNIIKAESLELAKDIYRDGEILNEIKLKEMLRDFLRFNDFKMNLDAYGVINSSSIITRDINIPKVELDEIASLLQFQIEEFLPINPEDYVIDHLILENDRSSEDDNLRLLLIAIPIGIVLSHLNLMKEAGLEPQVLDFQGNAVSKLLSFNETINGDEDIKDKTIVSIDLGYTNTEVTISINGNIEVSRVIGMGSKKMYENISNILNIPEDEAEIKVKNLKEIDNSESNMEEESRLLNVFRASLEETMDWVDKVVKYYDSREFGNKIHFIVLQGGISNIPGIKRIFSDYFSIPTIHLKELDRVKLYGDIWRYSNAIGGLIRKDEVKR